MNFMDVTVTYTPFAPALVGDTDDNGVVDLGDLNNVLNNFGATGENVGDNNDDDVVDLANLNNVLNNFGASGAAAALSVTKSGAREGMPTREQLDEFLAARER